MSPVIHLRAQRALIVGARRMHEPPGRQVVNTSLAQIAGHAMSSILLDALAVDIERMGRIKRTLALLPAQARLATPLRPIDALVIAPSQRLDDIAARLQASLPAPLRSLLRGAGVRASRRGAAALASYLPSKHPTRAS